jgi:hypothetical protein
MHSLRINPKVEEAREREAQKKASEKASKAKAAEDALWADEKNNKQAQRKAEEEARRQAEATKRAELKALQAREEAELAKKKAPTKLTAASIQQVLSLEQINAEKKRAEDEVFVDRHEHLFGLFHVLGSLHRTCFQLPKYSGPNVGSSSCPTKSRPTKTSKKQTCPRCPMSWLMPVTSPMPWRNYHYPQLAVELLARRTSIPRSEPRPPMPLLWIAKCTSCCGCDVYRLS